MKPDIEELLAWLSVATSSFCINNESGVKDAIRRILSAWPDVEAVLKATMEFESVYHQRPAPEGHVVYIQRKMLDMFSALAALRAKLEKL